MYELVVRTLGDMNVFQNQAFNQLLAAWHRREDARKNHDLRAQSSARIDMESARRQVRSQMYGPR